MDRNVDTIDDDAPLRQASLDKSVNTHSTKLLDLCKATGFRILNGRFHQTNMYNSISPQGALVIDYLLAQECCFSSVNYSNILPLTVWSDHCPIEFNLRCVVSRNPPVQHITKITWDNDKRWQFRLGLIAR